MSDWHRIATIADIPEGEARAFEIDDAQIAVAQINGAFYAFDEICSHAYVSLADGIIEGHEIECCAHGARFDVRSGEATCPPATEKIKTYPLKKEGTDLYVNIS